MQDLKVTWESTAPGDGVKWRGLHMLTEVVLEIRNGENWVSWSFRHRSSARFVSRHGGRGSISMSWRASEPIRPFALYEICARYRDNPSGLTSRKPVAWWADALSHTPGGAERREWRKFKSERVKEALEEINRETDLEIALIEHKQGRAVFEAQFSVRRKKNTERATTATAVDASLVLRAESLGIREMKLEGLLLEFGDERVREQLVNLERRAASSKLRAVDNPYSYLRTLLRNEEGEPPVEEKPALAPVAQQVAVNREYVDAASGRITARIAELKVEIGGLSPSERKSWADKALEELSRKRQLNAVVARRAEQGDVLHGLLGATVVRLYGNPSTEPTGTTSN